MPKCLRCGQPRNIRQRFCGAACSQLYESGSFNATHFIPLGVVIRIVLVLAALCFM